MKITTASIALLLAGLEGAAALTFVAVSGHMEINDSETFGSDEHASRGKEFDGIFLGSPTTDFKNAPTWVEKMGGEIRVEVRCSFRRQANDSVDVSCRPELYEGDDEDTDDLDSVPQERHMNVPRGQTLDLSMQLQNNKEDSPGDNADITITVTNTKIL
jgi:hypothetical protein